MRRLFITVLFICITATYSAGSALLSKSYVIRYDKGKDILCDPYVVQKGDWVFKLFKQKGEISHKDFPEFLAIFKRINPHIRNIDRIRPGQHILIPLKKLKKDSLPGQSSGIVTIPFVTISNLPDIIKPYSTEHIVQEGEFISRLIARGYDTKYGAKPYNEAIKLFRLINPDVVDLDQIYPGQKLYIPNTSLRDKPWYKSLFDTAGNIIVKEDQNSSDTKALTSFILTDKRDNIPSRFAKIASILDAKLLNKGIYSFPGHGKADYKLDLSGFPVIELKDKTKILLCIDKDKKINAPELNAIKSYWSNVKIVSIANKASTEQAFDAVMESFEKKAFNKNKISFSDQGLKVEVRGKWIIEQPYFAGEKKPHLCITPVNDPDERTPDSIVRYLEQHNIIIKDFLKNFTKDFNGTKHKSKEAQNEDTAGNIITIDFSDHKTIVNNLLTAMGYNYTQNVAITFPYAGIQIKALSNLISTEDGKSLLVDFGDIYGDAILSIKKTGLGIIQIDNKDNAHEVIRKILDALEVSYTKYPTFLAAKRPDVYNTSLTIPGYLISNKEKHKILLATVSINDDIVQFLINKGIKVIMSNSQ